VGRRWGCEEGRGDVDFDAVVGYEEIISWEFSVQFHLYPK